MNRQLSFVISGINHENYVIANFFKNSLTANASYVVKNINSSLKYLNLRYEQLFENPNKAKIKSFFYMRMSEPDWRVSMIKELLDLRDGLSTCNFVYNQEVRDRLNRNDILTILDYISRSRDYP